MSVSGVQKFLTASTEKASSKKIYPWGVLFWLGLSLIFAAFYGALGLEKAFRGLYLVQDDAREYVFWMQRFIDPDLFSHDLVADYFKSITPLGYASTYHLIAKLGLSPISFSKVLPILLGLVSTVYGFSLCLQIFPVPAAGFVSTLLLNQSLWFKDDLASATPRAFVYPLLLAFLFYLLKKRWVPVCLTIVLQGLFYPLILFISIGVLFLRLVTWKGWIPCLKRKQGLYCLIVLGLASLSMLPYILASSEFGPVITAVEARAIPELWPGGRHPFFDQNLWKFWLIGEHSGLLPPLMPPLIWMGLLLPWVLKNTARFPLIRQLRNTIAILPQIVLVSLGLFFAAHALLLKLFFPTRYTVHTLRIVMAIAAGITIVAMLDAIFRLYQRIEKSRLLERITLTLATATITVVLILYPHSSNAFPATNYRLSNENLLYQFLQSQPRDSLIATLSDEANNIPTFAQRAVLVGKEYALPFHLGYYDQIRQRSSELIRAQYSQNLVFAQQLIQKYKVTLWLLDRAAFTPEYLASKSKSWLRSFQPAFTESLTNLEQGTEAALAKLLKQCSKFETESLIVLEASCIVDMHPIESEVKNGDLASSAMRLNSQLKIPRHSQGKRILKGS